MTTADGASTTRTLTIAILREEAGFATITRTFQCLLFGPESETLRGVANAEERICVGADTLTAVGRALGH